MSCGVLAACVLVLAGCGGSLTAKDAGVDVPLGGDAIANDVRTDGVVDAIADGSGATDTGGGPIACGRMLTCTGTDVCMTWECGGPLRCIDPPDGGQCPTGTTFDSRCPGLGACVPDCFPSYACVPWPAACGGNLDCTCAAAVCNGMGSCLITRDRGIECGAV